MNNQCSDGVSEVFCLYKCPKTCADTSRSVPRSIHNFLLSTKTCATGYVLGRFQVSDRDTDRFRCAVPVISVNEDVDDSISKVIGSWNLTDAPSASIFIFIVNNAIITSSKVTFINEAEYYYFAL